MKDKRLIKPVRILTQKIKHQYDLRILASGILLLCYLHASAQYSDKYIPRLTRIIFLLDGSGSMKEPMDGSTKFELSKQIIVKYLDSLTRNNIKAETAVRVFGHQYPSSAKNCKDTRLELPFGRHTAAEVRARLDVITPQGWTLIAYALEQCANDFPEDPTVKNAIVLITDGIETCGGDPCSVASVFQQKRIALKPYIIGLGIPKENQNAFDCAAKFFDVFNAVTFRDAMSAVITQSLNPTTAQINLINEFGKPSETNVEVTMFDSYSGQLLYSFVHALNEAGFPDTLSLDPAGKYDIIVHSVPKVEKRGVELIAGTHNIIAIDVPQGSLKLTEAGSYKRETPLQCIIHQKGKNEILMVQDFNTTRKYLTGAYYLEILTLPRIVMRDVEITQGVTKEITVASPGTLNIYSVVSGIASIYVQRDSGLERIHEFKTLGSKETLLLQPGRYVLICRMNDKRSSLFTRAIDFEIISGMPATIRL